MNYRLDKQGNRLSVLGFGCMRFRRKGAGIDMEQAEQQLVAAIDPDAFVIILPTDWVYGNGFRSLTLTKRRKKRDTR